MVFVVEDHIHGGRAQHPHPFDTNSKTAVHRARTTQRKVVLVENVYLWNEYGCDSVRR